MRSSAHASALGLRRRWRAALLLHSLEPILETSQCISLLSQLDLGGGAALLQLEQILCLVPVELELQRGHATLSFADTREQFLALSRESLGALLQEVTVQQRENVALPPQRERDLAIVREPLR